jgi:hypothetical protein
LERIGNTLNVNKLEDWYTVTPRDIKQNGGSQILQFYKGSLALMLKTAYPEYLEDKERFYSLLKIMEDSL